VDLPENEIIVMIDQLRIQQVVINLLSNAIKFSKSGDTIKIEVKAKLLPKKGDDLQSEICISVIDQGMGISAQDISNLF